jgi:hypothetical protein
MSLDAVLNYRSMSEVRARLAATAQAGHLLRVAYQGYHGNHKPGQREAYFRQTFAQHHTRPPGPLTYEDLYAYLACLCHAIWVEEHAGLPWSLQDYSTRELRFLLEPTVDMEGWTSRNSGTSGCWGLEFADRSRPRDPMADAWYQAYPLSLYLAGREPDPRKLLPSLTAWIMGNFFHYYKRDDREDWPPDLYPSKDSWTVSLAEYFAERATGCHGTGKILTALLRSLNIPAIEVHYNGHGICYAPTLQVYVHGDLMADLTLLKDNSALVMSLAELESWIFHARDYLSFHDHVHSTDYEHQSVALRRRERDLFVAASGEDQDGPEGVPSLLTGRSPGYYAGVQARLPEFGIHEMQGRYYSRLVPIRGLDELPECGLVVEVSKEASGTVVITLENRGYDLASNEGIVLIDIDGGQHSGGYDLPLIQQGFVQGGGKTVIRTNFQLGRDEVGVTRVMVIQLPAPCRTIEVMRHLGKPLEPIGPVGPVIVDPLVIDP